MARRAMPCGLGITHSFATLWKRIRLRRKACGLHAVYRGDLRSMIEILTGTHRPGNNTLKVAREYQRLLKRMELAHGLLDLAELPADAFGPRAQRHPAIARWQEERLRPASAVLVLSPEYNGSMPGVLKALIDAMDPDLWKRKPVLLTGIATGRAGNLRGLDHLSNVFLHMGAWVHPDKLPISRLGSLWQGEGLEDSTFERMGQQVQAFAKDFLNSAEEG